VEVGGLQAACSCPSVVPISSLSPFIGHTIYVAFGKNTVLVIN